MIERDTLPLRLEAALRADIVSGALVPGSRLRGAELAKRYRVSLTPLREALQRLALQGFVELDPQQGARVAPISLDDVHDVYRLRTTLETLALRQSIENGDEEWRKRVVEVRDVLRREEEEFRRSAPAGSHRSVEWVKRHADFHLTLYSAVNSPWLMRFLAILSDHSERYRMLSVKQSNPDRDVLAEHERIAAAVETRDADAAEAALRDHLGKTVALLDAMFTATEADDDIDLDDTDLVEPSA